MSDDERRNTDFFPEHLHVLREKLDGETCATTRACCLLLADASVRAQTSTRWRRENADVPSGSFLESRATGVVT